MMPLILAEIGKENQIKKIGGSKEMKRHLEDMGFIPGSIIMLITFLGGNVIVKMKESRIAINEEMARCIMV